MEGKAAWLAEGLPAEGDVDDHDRIGALVASAATEPTVLDVGGDACTVRPNELIRDVRARLRDLGDDAPDVVHVTTPKGRLLGTIEAAALLATRR